MDPQETNIYLAILIAASVLAVIITFFVFTIIRHHRKSLQLYKEKIKAEITTLESERKRIASDLHDELGPLLSAIKLQINSLDNIEKADQVTIEKASEHLDNVLNRIRGIANNLVPDTLVRRGLIPTIYDLADVINRSGKFTLYIDIRINNRLPQLVEIHFYRIIQEILYNTLKYSNATNCNLLLKLEGNKLTLSIKENGKGFDFRSMIKKSSGLGLHNILSRIEILKGDIYIDTKPGMGVHYLIEIPSSPEYEKHFNH